MILVRPTDQPTDDGEEQLTKANIPALQTHTRQVKIYC